MPAVFPALGYTLLGLFLATLIGLGVGWSHPERVLPRFMHPTTDLVRIIYGVLAAWLLGGAIVFFFLANLSR